jgi:hypothetical protein
VSEGRAEERRGEAVTGRRGEQITGDESAPQEISGRRGSLAPADKVVVAYLTIITALILSQGWMGPPVSALRSLAPSPHRPPAPSQLSFTAGTRSR